MAAQSLHLNVFFLNPISTQICPFLHYKTGSLLKHHTQVSQSVIEMNNKTKVENETELNRAITDIKSKQQVHS